MLGRAPASSPWGRPAGTSREAGRPSGASPAPIRHLCPSTWTAPGKPKHRRELQCSSGVSIGSVISLALTSSLLGAARGWWQRADVPPPPCPPGGLRALGRLVAKSHHRGGKRVEKMVLDNLKEVILLNQQYCYWNFFFFFALWFLFSKSGNIEEITSILSPWLHHCRSFSHLPYSSMPVETSIRGIFGMRHHTSIVNSYPKEQVPHAWIFSLNPLSSSGPWVTSLWSCCRTPGQDFSLCLQSSWGDSSHYPTDNPICGTEDFVVYL